MHRVQSSCARGIGLCYPAFMRLENLLRQQLTWVVRDRWLGGWCRRLRPCGQHRRQTFRLVQPLADVLIAERPQLLHRPPQLLVQFLILRSECCQLTSAVWAVHCSVLRVCAASSAQLHACPGLPRALSLQPGCKRGGKWREGTRARVTSAGSPPREPHLSCSSIARCRTLRGWSSGRALHLAGARVGAVQPRVFRRRCHRVRVARGSRVRKALPARSRAAVAPVNGARQGELSRGLRSSPALRRQRPAQLLVHLLSHDAAAQGRGRPGHAEGLAPQRSRCRRGAVGRRPQGITRRRRGRGGSDAQPGARRSSAARRRAAGRTPEPAGGRGAGAGLEQRGFGGRGARGRGDARQGAAAAQEGACAA